MNSVTLIGRLGKNPEKVKRVGEGQTAVTSFSLAVDKGQYRKGPDDTEPFWFRIVCWGKTAENVEKYLAKGRLVGVQGHLTSRTYEDENFKNGEGQSAKRTMIETSAHNVQFLDKAPESSPQDSGQESDKENPEGGEVEEAQAS